MFNRKLVKCIKIYRYCTFLNVDQNRRLFTNHGFHLNGLGKDVISKQLVSHIYAWLLEKVTIPIGTGWKTETSNRVLDEGPSIAATESSMEIISPVKLNLTHTSQNRDPISPKRVSSRLSSRQRRLPITRSDDFLW
jgi:hypothetical protein